MILALTPYLMDRVIGFGLVTIALLYTIGRERCAHCRRPRLFSPLGQSCPTGDGDDFHEFTR